MEVGNWNYHSQYMVMEVCAYHVICVLSTVHLADG